MSKVKLKIGMEVSCIVNGLGYIDRFELYSDTYPIVASFNRGTLTYTADGREVKGDANPTLKLLNIPFVEDMEVECDIYGKGVVKSISELNDVLVEFENGKQQHYTTDGRINRLANQTLFPQYEI